MGASAQEQSSAMLQLSQAFGSGRLAGEEYKAMAESAPNLMRALAASMEVPIGALKQMAADGLITSAVMQKAFTDPALLASLREQAKGMETISGSWQELRNELTLYVGKSAQASGATSLISGAISGLAKNVETLAGGLQVIAGVYVARLIPSVTKYLALKVAESAAETASIAEKRASSAASVLKAQAEETLAVSALARARANVTAAESEVTNTRMVLASLVAERELEATRLKSQITDKGRQLSVARMAELRAAEVAITAQLARQEMALGAAQGVVLAETNTLTAAHGAAAVAENTHTASTVRLTLAQRALAASSTVLNGALALVGGTVGAVGLAAAGAAYLIVKGARESAQAIDKVVSSVDRQIEAMHTLNKQGLGNAVKDILAQIDALKIQGEAYQEAALAGAFMGDAIRRNAVELQAAEAVLQGYQTQLNNASDGTGRFAMAANDASRYITAMETGVVATGNAFMTAHDYIVQMGGAIDNTVSKSQTLITSLENQIKMVGMSAREQAIFKAELDGIAAESAPAVIAKMRELAGTNYDLAESARVAKEAEEELANAVQSRLDSYSNVINALGEMSNVAKLEFDLSMGEFKGAKPEDIALMREHAESVDAIAWADKRREAREYFEETEAGLQKQIDLMGNTSKAAEMQYDIEHGAYDQLSKDRRDALLGLTKELEAREENFKATQEIAEREEQIAKTRARNIQNILADFIENPFKDGLRGMLESFGQMLWQMEAQAMAADVMSWFNGGKGGGNSSLLGGAMKLAGMFMGGGGAATTALAGGGEAITASGYIEMMDFAGAKDSGGYVPPGSYAQVAEKRPELVNGVLVKGPANVTSGAKTAQMMGNTTQNVSVNISVVNPKSEADGRRAGMSAAKAFNDGTAAAARAR